jgi:hypothetical protein
VPYVLLSVRNQIVFTPVPPGLFQLTIANLALRLKYSRENWTPDRLVIAPETVAGIVSDLSRFTWTRY